MFYGIFFLVRIKKGSCDFWGFARVFLDADKGILLHGFGFLYRRSFFVFQLRI